MRSMKIILSCFVCFVAAVSVFAQGGKAEPKRIEFKNGASSTMLTGTLRSSQEMEYVFAARKGQTVTVKNLTNSAFDFRIFSNDNDVETEFDSSPALTLDLPGDGDYLFFVRRKVGRGARNARFKIVLTIR
jgi:hypothetical protein